MSEQEFSPPPRAGTPPSTWAIVLAGGNGTRLARLTRLLYGREVPKQFASLDGGATLLQKTMDRLKTLVPGHQTMVVVASGSEEIARDQLRPYPGAMIVAQPRNLGTGPGVLLPLAHIRALAPPDADVILTPSDQHFSRPIHLAEALQRGLAVAPRSPSGIALMGAEANADADDLGWIVRCTSDDPEVELVARFVEKPPRGIASLLRSQGALWNTMICMGKASALWNLCEKHLPEQTHEFTDYVELLRAYSLDPAVRASFLHQIYQKMSRSDFSRQVLESAQGLAVVALPAAAGWSDWGTPERVVSCLEGTAGLNELLRRIYERTMSRHASSPFEQR